MDNVPIGRSVPAEFRVRMASYKTFDEIPVAPGAHPRLDDECEGITDRQAVIAVAERLGHPRPDVFVSARFGIYSSPYPAKRLPSGELRPLDQKRPVWLVTFYGPGIKVMPRGWRSGYPRLPIIHVINALVDAVSGEVLSVGNG